MKPQGQDLTAGMPSLRFDVAGDILSTNAEAIRSLLAKRLADGGSSIRAFELNLPQTRMIDSVGLNLLVWLIKQVRAKGGKLRIAVSDSNVLRTFQFTRLDREADVVRVTGNI